MAGHTILAKLGAVDIYDDPQALGQGAEFQDLDYTNPEFPVLQSQQKVCAVLVKNDSGATLAPGVGVRMKAADTTVTLVGGLCGANQALHGVVDPWLSAPVPVGSIFWMIVEGPTRVLAGTGGLTPGALLQTAANGTFVAGTEGTNPVGHCGWSAGTTAAAARGRAYVRTPFGPLDC